MDLEIIYNPAVTIDELDFLGMKLNEEAAKLRDMPSDKKIAFFIYENGNVMGGVNALLCYGCMFIDQIWLDESIRNSGYGTKLIKKCEEMAKEHGCKISTLTTMDWEAKDFYLKLGYNIEFERDGYLKG